MRDNYSMYGVDGYYKNIKNYTNPHMEQIKTLLVRNLDKINGLNVLDMCCGSGDVTTTLLNNGIMNVKGSDKYTKSIYIENTGKKCLELSFKDILGGNMNGFFSTIICSFALHLVDEKDLMMLVLELFRHTGTLIIISPHKRPFLDKIHSIDLIYQDHSLTSRGKRVYFKVYKESE